MTWIDISIARPSRRTEMFVGTDGEKLFFAYCESMPGEKPRYYNCEGRELSLTHWFPIPTIPTK